MMVGGHFGGQRQPFIVAELSLLDLQLEKALLAFQLVHHQPLFIDDRQRIEAIISRASDDRQYDGLLRPQRDLDFLFLRVKEN